MDQKQVAYLAPTTVLAEQQYQEFKERHASETVKKGDFKTYKGDCFVGIDAGSTTTKLVVIDRERNFALLTIW